MLVSATEMLNKAVAGKYAVGQFNINNLEWTKAILATAQENNSPVILGVSEGAGKYMTGFKTVAAMVKAMIEEMNITVPVALHLAKILRCKAAAKSRECAAARRKAGPRRPPWAGGTAANLRQRQDPDPRKTAARARGHKNIFPAFCRIMVNSPAGSWPA